MNLGVESPSSKKQATLATYESTLPKFNLGVKGNTGRRQALQRLKELRQLKILDKRQVEKMDLFEQRPAAAYSLFLAGKSLKYCGLKSVSVQTGDDNQEVGCM